MKLACFLHDPTNVGNLTSGSSSFSKPSLYIWKLLVHILLRPSLKDFEHNLANMWNAVSLCVGHSVLSDSFRPLNCSSTGSSVHGILQVRILEWVAVPFSRWSSQPRIQPRSPALQADSLLSATREAQNALLLLLLSRFSRVRLCATPETAAHQAPPSLGFPRQEHWSGLPFPSPMHESEKWKGSRSVMSDS